MEMEITTDRCYLKRLTSDDKEEVIEIYINPETRRFLGGALSVQTAEEKIEYFIKNQEKTNDENRFTVRLKQENTLIGLIYLSPYYDSGFYELSYEFLPEFWGQGYAFEVMKASLNHCRIELGLRKIYAETQTKNARSRNLLEKLGYKLEKEIVRFNENQTVYSINL